MSKHMKTAYVSCFHRVLHVSGTRPHTFSHLSSNLKHYICWFKQLCPAFIVFYLDLVISAAKGPFVYSSGNDRCMLRLILWVSPCVFILDPPCCPSPKQTLTKVDHVLTQPLFPTVPSESPQCCCFSLFVADQSDLFICNVVNTGFCLLLSLLVEGLGGMRKIHIQHYLFYIMLMVTIELFCIEIKKLKNVYKLQFKSLCSVRFIFIF